MHHVTAHEGHGLQTRVQLLQRIAETARCKISDEEFNYFSFEASIIAPTRGGAVGWGTALEA